MEIVCFHLVNFIYLFIYKLLEQGDLDGRMVSL